MSPTKTVINSPCACAVELRPGPQPGRSTSSLDETIDREQLLARLQNVRTVVPVFARELVSARRQAASLLAANDELRERVRDLQRQRAGVELTADQSARIESLPDDCAVVGARGGCPLVRLVGGEIALLESNGRLASAEERPGGGTTHRERVRGRGSHSEARPPTRARRGGGKRAADRVSDGVLLTGATGFVGMELLARYLEHTDRRLYALVRGADNREVKARMERVLQRLYGTGHPFAGRVVAVRGDLTRSRLGIRAGLDGLAEQVSEIVHCAASVSFELELEDARAINVDGTRRVLEFAQRCHERGGLRRFTYISTAYIAGEHVGCFSEDDVNVGQRFRNTYEQSKFEAECLLASWRERFPITVLRPSIIVGERDSGWTASFNVLYWPLRAFARGVYVALPARGDAPVDVVPVDYVADATFALSQAPEAEGATFHLTAGAHASNVDELVELASGFFGCRSPRLIEPSLYRRVVHPLLVRAARDDRYRRALIRSEVLFPYFATRVAYDNRRARVALAGSGIAPSPLRAYFDRLVEFALAAEWGRRQIPRASVVVGEVASSFRSQSRVPEAPARVVMAG
jgi:thioester reductase-like protein